MSATYYSETARTYSTHNNCFRRGWATKLSLIASFLLGGATAASAQQEVSVDQFSGTAHVGIPLSSASIQGATIGLGLDYSASGVKIDDDGGAVGTNWSLVGVPVISREVHGLPDDVVSQTSVGQGRRIGWLRGNQLSSVPGYIQPIINGATGSAAFSCLDNVHRNNSANEIYDTEPDIFSYSLPGHAGKFVFDEQGAVRTIPYDPVTITITPGNDQSTFSTFVIKTPEGVTYNFNECDFTSRSDELQTDVTQPFYSTRSAWL